MLNNKLLKKQKMNISNEVELIVYFKRISNSNFSSITQDLINQNLDEIIKKYFEYEELSNGKR